MRLGCSIGSRTGLVGEVVLAVLSPENGVEVSPPQ